MKTANSQTLSLALSLDELLNQVNFVAPWHYHIDERIRQASVYLNDNQQGCLYEHLNQLTKQLYPQGLTTGYGQSLQFVHQAVLDEMNQQDIQSVIAYETLIAETGQIPTRDNLHDFFNAWIWLTFPKTKALLNRHQAKQIAQAGISGSRGRVRDAITVLDENGAILVTSNPEIAQALQAFDWQNALVQPRQQWLNVARSLASYQTTHTQSSTQAMLMICGHALLEQLVEPRKPLCSHTFILLVEESFFSLPLIEQVKQVDDRLVDKLDDWLTQVDVTPRQLSPLPILGVPYFWVDNINKDFYEDSYVFRSGRRKR